MIPLYYYYYNFALLLFLLINPCTQYNNPTITTTNTTMPEKRNFSAYSLSSLQEPSFMVDSNDNRSYKKLRRLPHVFSKVLELPFNSDADVFVEERHDCFKFTVKDDGVVGGGGGVNVNVKAHVIDVHPGITKVVIRPRDNPSRPFIDENGLDVWRFRLPPSARPELATAGYARGELVVTVPKNGWGGNNNTRGGDCKGGFKGNMGNIVVVQ